ncbi:MAG: rhomboid family intramembrane serine protease [Bacteroidetes bacterium]|nr:rhomboid family intramembrane serine protease [Bacteroidota bacterium]
MFRLIANLIDDAIYPLILVMAMWVAFFFNIKYNLNLEIYGLKPHDITGLKGILFMPFLHENFEHLFSNTVPVLVAGFFLFYYFKNLTWLILSFIWLGSGIFIWFVGQNGTLHIGASGIVYGLVFFLLITGFLRRHKQLLAVALIMVFLYGSIMWGLFPDYVKLLKENISWEGHLGGAMSGILIAILLLKKGPQTPKHEIIEDEDDEIEIGQIPYWMEGVNENEIDTQEKDELKNSESSIKYKYVPKNANPWEKDD